MTLWTLLPGLVALALSALFGGLAVAGAGRERNRRRFRVSRRVAGNLLTQHIVDFSK